MPEKKITKTCPLSHHSICKEEECAWYDAYEKACAVLLITKRLDHIVNSIDANG